MNAYYEDGATHNDHHKEMNIQVVGSLSTEAIDKLIAGFMGDEACRSMEQEAQTADFCPSEEEVSEGDFMEEEPSSADSEALSPELSTAKAQAVLRGLQRIGVLDDDFQPIGLSLAEKGYLARQIAYKLGIDHPWVVFGKLWHDKSGTLRSAYNRAMDMRKIAAFEEKIKEIIS